MPNPPPHPSGPAGQRDVRRSGRAHGRLAGYASRFRMLVVMANYAASVGTYASVGKSAVWAPDGALLAEAAGTESFLVVATRTGEGWRGKVARV